MACPGFRHKEMFSVLPSTMPAPLVSCCVWALMLQLTADHEVTISSKEGVFEIIYKGLLKLDRTEQYFDP